MKRIIDIDEPTFNDIIATNTIDGHFHRVDWCIRNSKPYEERPKGRWIRANNTYYCSHCKHYAYESQRFDFCQDCGADMRFGKDYE